MIKVNQDNKNIFQICIGLNDNIDSLKEFRKRLLALNPSYQYHYIDSEDLLDEIMIKDFKNSEDPFDQDIYKCFESIEIVLRLGIKAKECTDENKRKEIHKICILVSKTDIFRLAMIYKYGGFYLDLSKACEVDIDKEFSKYDVVLIRSVIEIHSSMIYAKKNNIVIKNLLGSVIKNCLSQPNRKMGQLGLAGPGMYKTTITQMLSGFNFAVSGDFSLFPYNGIVLYNEQPKRYVLFNTQWKQMLHQPDPHNEKIKFNAHWLYDKF